MENWFDAAPCGLLQTADDGVILHVNRTFCAWVGRTVDELVQRRRFQDLLTTGARIFHQTHWSPLLRMQSSISEVKLEIVHCDGSKLPMVLNAVRREVDGNVRHEIAAFVARDRDRYERELVSARKRLEDLVAETQRLHADAKDRASFAEQMIGIVSHDLRNPLSAISMGASVLAESASDEERRIVDLILSASGRAAELISDLLDFTAARVGSGIAITPRPVDLHAVCREALEELRLAYPNRVLEHSCDGPGPCVVDDKRVVQVLGNLVSNAVVYGDREATITVTTRGGACPELLVHNTGPPIPAGLTVFEPMTRGADVGTQARSVGLGLYIVREIARAHGGTASFHSTADNGNTFTVVFGRNAKP